MVAGYELSLGYGYVSAIFSPSMLVSLPSRSNFSFIFLTLSTTPNLSKLIPTSSSDKNQDQTFRYLDVNLLREKEEILEVCYSDVDVDVFGTRYREYLVDGEEKEILGVDDPMGRK